VDVLNAPEFPAIAKDFLACLTRADLVIAHNAHFDIGLLHAVLEHFSLPKPVFDYACTCNLARRAWPDMPNYQLKTLTEHIGHDFNHHHAQADAEAAGRVMLAMMKHMNANTPQELFQRVGVESKRFLV
jgi:DNA polymerase-3 subunit epsilon